MIFLIKKLDIFTIKSELRFKKKTDHQTILGGILTMILIILMILSLISFGSEVIKKQLPETNIGEEYDIYPKQHEINSLNFGLAFGLQNSNVKHYINNKIYKAHVYQDTLNRLRNETDGSIKLNFAKQEIPIEICSKDHFPEKFHFYFLKLDIKNLFCIAKNHTKYFLRGTFDNDLFKSIKIVINECVGNNCESKDIIDKELFSGYFAMYYIDKIINPSSLKSPFKEYPTDFFTAISNSVRKNTDYYFKRVKIISDEGFLLESKNTIEDINVKNFFEQYIFSKNNANFFNMNFRLDNIQVIYTRRYKKVQDVLAQVGGIFKVKNYLIYIFVILLHDLKY